MNLQVMHELSWWPDDQEEFISSQTLHSLQGKVQVLNVQNFISFPCPKLLTFSLMPFEMVAYILSIYLRFT